MTPKEKNSIILEYKEYIDSLVNIIVKRYSLDWNSIDDYKQEVYLDLLESLDKYDSSKSKVTTFIFYRALHSSMYNAKKERRRKKLTVPKGLFLNPDGASYSIPYREDDEDYEPSRQAQLDYSYEVATVKSPEDITKFITFDELISTPSLTSTEEACLRLLYQEGLNREEVAESLETSRQNIEQAERRGLKKIDRNFKITKEIYLPSE